jgi:hypothetical protein
MCSEQLLLRTFTQTDMSGSNSIAIPYVFSKSQPNVHMQIYKASSITYLKALQYRRIGTNS